KGEKGVSVLTGCAHPGIINVLKYAKNRIGVEDLYMVFGGFHLAGMGREAIGEIISGLKKFGVQKAGPTHCSGDKAKRIFCGKYLDNFIDIKAGNEFQV
ncbi:MAG: MBL fold metallo-hydrolase, partial [Candidatus Omnitrophica bacterium]|nr:MBL fold metallo-hydrolase [Candidatus Omnitrophota bacterium]